MLPQLVKNERFKSASNAIFLINNIQELDKNIFSAAEAEFIIRQFADKKLNTVILNKLGNLSVVVLISEEKTNEDQRLEKFRKAGESLLAEITGNKISELTLIGSIALANETLAFAEGMMLGNYQFLKYRKDKAEKESSLTKIVLINENINQQQLDELIFRCKAVYTCRSLINEPLSALNAEKLASEFELMAIEAGIKTEILNKQKIESLKMGGLLAVNRGSVDPPTFTILEYKPVGAVNEQPIVFVGKGVVYDTGGMSLKPTASMDTMKSDMSGAAAVVSAVYAIALSKLPVYVIALMPATDNRTDGNAYVPGDVITMMDGTTVEVLNTDAEGRLILADALTYAKKYNPQLVIDMATLTGAAEAALGKYGIAGMHRNAEAYFPELIKSGFRVHERIAEFPFWEDYEELLKSEIADLKNIGGRFGGAITAGKFLQHFTEYPWIHLDIAGPAFLDKRDSYRGSGATGVGVRLLFDFIKEFLKQKS